MISEFETEDSNLFTSFARGADKNKLGIPALEASSEKI